MVKSCANTDYLTLKQQTFNWCSWNENRCSAIRHAFLVLDRKSECLFNSCLNQCFLICFSCEPKDEDLTPEQIAGEYSVQKEFQINSNLIKWNVSSWLIGIRCQNVHSNLHVTCLLSHGDHGVYFWNTRDINKTCMAWGNGWSTLFLCGSGINKILMKNRRESNLQDRCDHEYLLPTYAWRRSEIGTDRIDKLPEK